MDIEAQIAITEAIEAALEGGPAVLVATVTGSGDPPWLEPGAKLLVRPDGARIGGLGPAPVDDAVAEHAIEAHTAYPRIAVETLYVGPDGQTTTRRHASRAGDAELMLQIWEPPARLIVVGGGHVGLALATFGEQLGFAVTVIDDREDFANRERFPMAEHVLFGEIGEQLDTIALDRSAHVVLVSRGHRQDEIALRHAVVRPTGYLGMIGSQRRTATVLQHLRDEGFDAAALAAVSTPIGLDIGAETPEEIALAILAEIVMLRRGRSGERMRDQRGVPELD
ncbi:MAG: XdhC/CoxI family protein [Chloroflexi bacterium]|nr:XdhC/CoxI family protein [Chloroflexota bacterium]MDA1148277.1 XdhC/CoxI family protein [Chloroflexota bacterium]MQC83258.1 xanthine dehydrogenase [Chloroflexota bacterium]